MGSCTAQGTVQVELGLGTFRERERPGSQGVPADHTPQEAPLWLQREEGEGGIACRPSSTVLAVLSLLRHPHFCSLCS